MGKLEIRRVAKVNVLAALVPTMLKRTPPTAIMPISSVDVVIMGIQNMILKERLNFGYLFSKCPRILDSTSFFPGPAMVVEPRLVGSSLASVR